MKVIFHGDDFGLTSGINRGIIRAFTHGLLSSTSLVAGGEAAQEAIGLARAHPELDVGIHLTLCDEKPVLPREDLPSIPFEGHCFPSRERLFFALLAKRIDRGQVEAEWRAQIERALHAGLALSHLDSHQFVHFFPGLFTLSTRLAARYRIPFVRSSLFEAYRRGAGAVRLAEWFTLRTWYRLCIYPQCRRIRTIPCTGFLHAGGRLRRGIIMRSMERMQQTLSLPVVEWMLHPGSADRHTREKYAHWRYRWDNDRELLTDRSLAEALRRRGITTTTYREAV